MRRRRFLKAALGTIVGVCLPLEAIPRAKPPLSSIYTPGMTMGRVGSGGVEIWDVPSHTMILRTTISYEEVERARRGGAAYFCEKLREMTADVKRRNEERVLKDFWGKSDAS